jgi:hypothetical protein
MDTLSQILREEVAKYAGNGQGANLRLFAILDDEHLVYAVNAVDYPDRDEDEFAGVMILARIYEDKIVIEEDATDRPLLDALTQRGINREQIILAYDGEPIPDASLYRDV